MTNKQFQVLSHIFFHGVEGLEAFSGTVIHNCCKKGWIEVDENQPFPYGQTFAECEWTLTDKGRRALHEARS